MILSLTAEICQPSQSCICDTSCVPNMMIIMISMVRDDDKHDDDDKYDENYGGVNLS